MKRSTLESVYRKYMPEVYRYLRTLCGDDAAAEDLVQETFYRAYVHLENYKDEKVKPWLFRVAYNAFIDLKRKERRSIISSDDFFHRLPDDDRKGPESVILQKEEQNMLMAWILRLPELQKQAVILYDIHQFSYQESADIMGITLSHFKILLFRARQQLRKNRERNDQDER
ncbi:sigma-70 family RNA polymerase sigma factor [Paenibacillus sp. HJL G12]|uniref:Sigma-70 family RNA polymerase sigma factor n=1 Tax=Paenibacillus dendrobii TaxID=2691084 RepID=A0A7X3IL03_9BACL|nr:sigma-70 family RNA polymerase sigma factor [Paenibacillus dendrobii]MWV44565.1 sigma-70 family RNA polymerase sigma factor [Paenibacillus dendrobii]